MDNRIYRPFMETDNFLSMLNKIALFGGLSKKQLLSIFKFSQVVSYSADERIFSEGDEPSYIYIIRCGQVKLVADIDNEPLEVVDLTVGDCFGEVALIGIQPHSVTAVAVEETELIVLTSAALLSFYKTDKDLFSRLILNIARETCRRLHKADQVLLHYVQLNRLKKKSS